MQVPAHEAMACGMHQLVEVRVSAAAFDILLKAIAFCQNEKCPACYYTDSQAKRRRCSSATRQRAIDAKNAGEAKVFIACIRL